MWFRLGFVVVTLAGGAGILIYLISWLIIPVILGLAVVIGSLGRANRQT